MSSKEKVVEIAHDREGEIPQRIQERIVRDRYTGLPYLITPIDIQNAENSAI